MIIDRDDSHPETVIYMIEHEEHSYLKNEPKNGGSPSVMESHN